MKHQPNNLSSFRIVGAVVLLLNNVSSSPLAATLPEQSKT
jgi:hypothetical protein